MPSPKSSAATRAQAATKTANSVKPGKPTVMDRPNRFANAAAPPMVSKPASKAEVKPVRRAKPVKAPKLRQKPVRDSFTMPEADFALIATLKARLLSAKRETKKSELLRAGLHALNALDTPALVAALGHLEPVKIGRPKQGP